MRATIVSPSPKRTRSLGRALGKLLQPGDIVLLTGELGSGKTQFAKGIAQGLGIARPITSPTYNLIYEYRDDRDGRVLLRHFDLYRLEDKRELNDIDYFGLLEDNVVSVVEWGDKFPDALPLDFLLIDFEFENEKERILSYEATGKRRQELMKAVENAAEGAFETGDEEETVEVGILEDEILADEALEEASYGD